VGSIRSDGTPRISSVEEQTQCRPPEPYHLFVVGIEHAAYIFFKDEIMHLKRWPGRDAWEIRPD